MKRSFIGKIACVKGATFCFLLLFNAFIANGQTPTEQGLIQKSDSAIIKGDYRAGIAFLQIALAQNAQNEVALIRIAFCYNKLEEYNNALDTYTLLTELQPGNATYWNEAGWFHILLGDFEAAENNCAKALKLNDCNFNIYLNLGHIKAIKKEKILMYANYNKAISYLPNKPVCLTQAINSLDAIGALKQYPYNTDNFIKGFNAGYMSLDKKNPKANDILDNIYQLSVYEHFQLNSDSIVVLKEAFLVEEQKSESMRTYVLRDFYLSLGWWQYEYGSKSLAIQNYLSNVIAISNDLKDTACIIDVLHRVGFNEADGLPLMKQALDLAKRSQSIEKEFMISIGMGDKIVKTQRDTALQYYHNSYHIAEQQTRKDLKSISINRLMVTFTKAGQYDSTSFYYQKARANNSSGDNIEGQIIDDLVYFSSLQESGNIQMAIDAGNKMLDYYKAKPGVDISDLYEGMGIACNAIRRYHDARSYFKMAIASYSDFIDTLPSKNFEFTSEKCFLSFKYLISYALEKRDIPALIEITEQSRVNFLYPSLNGKRFVEEGNIFNSIKEGLLPDELAIIFGNNLESGESFGIAVSNQKQLLSIDDYVIMDSLMQKHNTVDWTKIFKHQVAGLQGRAFTENVIKSYSMLSIIATHLNSMMGGDKTRSVKLGVSSIQGNVEAEMKAFNEIIYTFYVKPFEKFMEGKRTIYLSCDLGSALIPFESIQNEKGVYMGALYNFIYVPSFTVQSLLKKRSTRNEGEVIALGNPDYSGFSNSSMRGKTYDFSFDQWSELPGTAAELLAIKSREPEAVVVEREHLNESSIKSLSGSGRLAQYDIVHFALHGLVSIQNHKHSGLILTEPAGTLEDGFLQFEEITKLKLNARLVCLSACETAAGIPENGIDIMNLPMAFFMAGANSIMASWWKIDDEATGLFMTSFYNYIINEKKPYSEALWFTRQAFINGVYGEKYKAPYYWAPFRYFGY